MSQIENFGTFSFFIIPYCNILSFLQLRRMSPWLGQSFLTSPLLVGMLNV